MERILPIKPDQINHATCWDANWLSIVLSNDKFLPWYIEHFISLHTRNDFFVHYYDTYNVDYCSVYNEILDIYPLEAFLGEIDDVVSFTKKRINDGCYVNITLDLYYIDFSENYQTKHYFHGPLVFGYNDEKKVFFGYDLLFGISEYKYDQYKAGCESLFSSIGNNIANNLDKGHKNYQISKKFFRIYDMNLYTKGHLTCVKNQDFRKKPLLGRIFNTLEECLEGNIIKNEKDEDYTKWCGISLYDKFNKDVFSEWDQVLPRLNERLHIEDVNDIYLAFKTIVESKQGLKYRIQYLHNNRIISNADDLLNRIEYLCERLKIAYSHFVKFGETQNMHDLDYVRSIMNHIEDIDREVLERSSDAIFSVIKHDLVK